MYKEFKLKQIKQTLQPTNVLSLYISYALFIHGLWSIKSSKFRQNAKTSSCSMEGFFVSFFLYSKICYTINRNRRPITEKKVYILKKLSDNRKVRSLLWLLASIGFLVAGIIHVTENQTYGFFLMALSPIYFSLFVRYLFNKKKK